jgi:glyoxylase-like metal-dependent hydrolase (beta-lactamase superfamily II)
MLFKQIKGQGSNFSYVIAEDKKLLTGDTLTVGGVGPMGMSGGDKKSLYDSLFKKLLSLEDDMEVHPGHDNGEKASSTLVEEKRTNKALKARSFEELAELMKKQ